MEDKWFVAFMVFIVLAVGTVLTMGALYLFTFFTGTYSYEYRCTDNVVERRLEWWGLIYIGGFESIDGDPAGACEEVEVSDG